MGGMVTMKDIAANACVSISTVSLVINHHDKGRVKPEIAANIWKVADELGYHPNAMARSLRSGRTHTIAFISDQVATTPYAGEIIHGAQDAARQLGYMMFIIDADGERNIDRDIDRMLSWGVDGYIYAKFANRYVSVPPMLDDLQVVVVNAEEHTAIHPRIEPDEVGIGYDATKRLIDAGCRRIAYIGCDEPAIAQFGRLKGYHQALEEAGLPFDERLTNRVSYGRPALEAVCALLDGMHPDGVFAFNDARAVYVYDYAFQHGLTIGKDLSVIGVDNHEVICDTTVPPLTSVELPHYEMGFWGACKIISLIEGRDPIKEKRATPSYTAAPTPPLDSDGPTLIHCSIIEKESIAGEPRGQRNTGAVQTSETIGRSVSTA
jgi:LacI family transcriptional regulator